MRGIARKALTAVGPLVLAVAGLYPAAVQAQAVASYHPDAIGNVPVATDSTRWSWQSFTDGGYVWMRNYYDGLGRFDFRLGGGGAVAEMRYVPGNFQPLLSPSFQGETDRVIQGVLWALNIEADDTNVSDRRWNVNLAGTSDGTFSRTIVVEQGTSRLDVWSVPDKQWTAALDDDFGGSDAVSSLTRYETLDDGILRVRRVMRLPSIRKNGVSQSNVNFYYENWTPLRRGANEFTALALGLDATGTPNWWYRAGYNIPAYPEWSVTTTHGYAMVYKEGAHNSSPVAAVAFGTSEAQRFATSATAAYVFNSMDWDTGIGVLPGLHVDNAQPGSIVDLEFRIVTKWQSDAGYSGVLASAASQVAPPALYGPGYAFTGELATIVSRLRNYLTTASGSRTDRLADLLEAPPPVLTVSSISVPAGQPVQVTVQGGPGNARDWVALNATSAADTAWVDWKYLNGTRTAPATGVTSATLTFSMPATAGTYEFRFFKDNTYTKLATSPTVTVTAATTPVIEVTPTRLAFGTVNTGVSLDKTVTVKNAGVGTLTGDATVSGAGYSLVGTTTYSLTANQTTTLTVRFAPTAGGASSGTLTLTGGGGATVPLTGTRNAAAYLTVDRTSAYTGQPVQVTVGNGPGNPRDWLGMYLTSTTADTGWIDWKYFSGTRTPPATGSTTATITFTLPATAGSYNFRLFPNDTFTKLATSPTVTVTAEPPPAIQVSPTSLAFGTVTTGTMSDQTVMVTNVGGGTLTGSGSVSGTGFSLVGTSTYSLTANQTATLTVRFAPTTAGAATGTLTLTGGAGATVSLTGTGANPPPTITPSTTTATPGQTVQVTIANGPRNPSDWVAMHTTSAADNVYLAWKYLNGTTTLPATGLTSATISFTMPTTAGTYNFRFFQGGNNAKLATSATVTVADAPPALDVTPTSLAFGTVNTGTTSDLTVTVKNTGGGTLTGSGSVTGTGFSLVGTSSYSLTANQTATLTVRFAPTVAGAATGTLTLTGGAGATVSLTGTGATPSATITVSTTTATTGQTIQVTVANGPGNPSNWVAMHASSAADTVYLDWLYLNGTKTLPVTGLTSATLNFTLPTTAGTYNFRFYSSGYTKLATSATVTVAVATSPVIDVTPTSLAFGTVTTGTTSDLTVTVKNIGSGTLSGSGTVSGAGFSLVGTSTYSLTANQTATQTVRFAPTVAGAATGTLTLTGGAGATVSLTGTGATPSATITVSTTTATLGQTIQVTVANGPGNPGDWVGMHATSAADTVYLGWKYLNGTTTIPALGLTSATIGFTMPTMPGTYNFRFFQTGGYTRLATSATVTVQ